MDDLRREADHARRMLTAAHRPDCTGHALGPAAWDGRRPACPGCVTPRDRILWRILSTGYDTRLGLLDASSR